MSEGMKADPSRLQNLPVSEKFRALEGGVKVSRISTFIVQFVGEIAIWHVQCVLIRCDLFASLRFVLTFAFIRLLRLFANHIGVFVLTGCRFFTYLGSACGVVRFHLHVAIGCKAYWRACVD